ncbi:MAG: hypothetical protein Q4C72_09810 [Eubacteriales bacterium]|nr:hypothetical protein [Eubacteriales bacterium]
MMKKNNRYPEKTSLNLAMRERTINSPSRIIPIAVVLAVLIGLFAKFAVIDRLMAVNLAQREVAEIKRQVDELDAANAGYDELLDEYALHSTSWMSTMELALVDRAAVFGLLESAVLPSAQLRDLSMQENTLSLSLTGLSLRDASDIVTRLKARDDVLDVSVYTAGSAAGLDNTRTGSVTMTITLTNGNPLPTEDETEGGAAS